VLDSAVLYSSSQTPLLIEEVGPHFKNTQVVLERTKILWVPTGPKTKNECPGEGQQQINGSAQSLKGLNWLALQWCEGEKGKI
jgi:hypothetical protein